MVCFFYLKKTFSYKHIRNIKNQIQGGLKNDKKGYLCF